MNAGDSDLDQKKLISPSQYLKNLKEILDNRGEQPELNLINLPRLNGMIWGVQRKKMTVIGARPSNCKSAFAMNIALDLAMQKKRVLFLTLEMPPESVYERMFCYAHRIDNYKILTGKFKDYLEQWIQFEAMVNTLDLFVTNMIGETWENIDQLLSSQSTKPDCVIVDHIQEIRGEGAERISIIDDYLTNLRAMAIRDNFALIIVSQINRLGQGQEDKMPKTHQLKGSGGLEEKADIIILLHYYHKYDPKRSENDIMIDIAKNRSGRTGFADVKYLPQYYLFEEEKPGEKTEKTAVKKQPKDQVDFTQETAEW